MASGMYDTGAMQQSLFRIVGEPQPRELQNKSVAALSTPIRANFPLPRELRDRIYGYLLQPEHITERAPWQGWPEAKNGLVCYRAYDCSA